MLEFRAERSTDISAIHQLNADAFDSDAEARLVTALRRDADPYISLVATMDATLVAHLVFSPVTLAGHSRVPLLGLAPMAVAPSHQRRGLGSALVESGLEVCRRFGAAAVVVLGHPGYYPRFGFQPASRFGLRSEYEVPDEAFMALELRDGALDALAGSVQYHPAFAQL